MNTTTRPETSQARLNRLMAAAQQRLPVGATITNRRGTARWNGDAWVYGKAAANTYASGAPDGRKPWQA